MKTTRYFRFGVVAAQAGSSAEWIAKARRAETLGYSTFLVPDFVGPGLSPLPALAVAATATTVIRMGTFVLANEFHHPVFVARESATLDFLSDGRFELGLGAGRAADPAEYRKAGVPSPANSQRVGRLTESLGIIKSLLGGETVDGSGPHYDVVGAEIYPRLARRPPILVAGVGNRLLALAAKQADIVGLGVSPADSEDSLREKIEWIQREAGDRIDDLEISVNLQAVVGDGPPNLRVNQRLRYLFRTDPDQLVRDHSPVVVSGTVDEMCEQLTERRAKFGISYVTLADDLMEEFAPVVARLVGR